MLSWTVALVATILVLGGLFAVLTIFSLSRSPAEGDLDWQIARLEREVDLILTHLGIGHDKHAPKTVIGRVRTSRIQEAVQEYRRLTGSRLSVARREVQCLQQRLALERQRENAGG